MDSVRIRETKEKNRRGDIVLFFLGGEGGNLDVTFCEMVKGLRLKENV
jgi:hypothetical protein